MESRKMAPMNLFEGQQWRCRHRRQAADTEQEGEGGTSGESSMETRTSPHVKQLVGSCCITRGAQPGAL